MESKNAYEFLKNEINKAIPGKFKTVLELANTSGVHQGNLNSFLNGTRKGRKNKRKRQPCLCSHLLIRGMRRRSGL